MVFIQPNEFWIFRQVFDALAVVFGIFIREDPADMSPVETMLFHRVHVFGVVRVLMVVTVMGRPPERPLLSSHPAKISEAKLEEARCFKRAVRKIPMETARDAELTHDKKCDHREQHPDARRIPRSSNHRSQSGEMEKEEEDRSGSENQSRIAIYTSLDCG